MTDQLFLGSYWGARAESAEGAAEKVVRLVRKMEQIDPALTNWRSGQELPWVKQGASCVSGDLESACLVDPLLAEIPRDGQPQPDRSNFSDYIAELLRNSLRERQKSFGKIIDHCMSIQLSSAELAGGGRAQINLSIGGVSNLLNNALVLYLPIVSWNTAVSVMTGIFDEVIEIFNPDFMRLCASSYSKRANRENREWVGWMAYAKASLHEIPSDLASKEKCGGTVLAPREATPDKIRINHESISDLVTKTLNRNQIILIGPRVGHVRN